jgi:hypothetical protein
MRTPPKLPLALVAIFCIDGCAISDNKAATTGYGAAAYAAGTGDWRLRWQASDAQRARQRVLADCAAPDCRVVLEFGPGQCGTLALNRQGEFGVGMGDTPMAAETVALAECRRAGSDCRVAPAECNR